MPRVFVNDQLLVRNSPRQITAVVRGHHEVLVAVGDQHRDLDAAEILRHLPVPRFNRL